MKPKTMNTGFLVAFGSMAIISGVADAQSFVTQIDSKVSGATLNAAAVINTVGTLIGDYDPDTNPDGTQTRPGFFGGSGNQAIDTSTSISSETAINTHPAGSLAILPNFDLATIEINGLTLDLLNGQPGSTDLSVTMFYDTFHTVSPSFIYPGGVEFTVPLGQVGGINQALLSQNAPGIGTLSPTEQSDLFDFVVGVPAQLDLSISQSLPGSDPTDTPISVPIVLPIAGQLTVLDDGSIRLTGSISPDPISIQVPISGVTLPDIPFELPTFGAETASVVLSLMPDSIDVDADLQLTISALGTAQSSCPPDINNDGELNFFDVSAFLAAFTAADPIADFNDDGQFNFFDVSIFLTAFGGGCP